MEQKEQWKIYYKEMKRIRMVENSIADNYNNKIREMHTPIHLCNGQEAVAVGVCQQLKREDTIFSNHRCHGHYLAKGGDLKKMIAELFTKKTGCCEGKGGSMHLTDRHAGVGPSSAIVAGNVPIATGYAMGLKQQKKDEIVVVFFGDGASEEGAVFESISFAQIHSLPIIYVCENNLYAISTDFEYREPVKQIARKFQTIVETHVINGNDVIEVAEYTKNAIKKIKKEEGPVFIECMTYRYRDHHNVGTGIDIYRTREEWLAWKQRDPIICLENRLLQNNWISKEEIEMCDRKFQKEIDEAFEYAHESPLPTKADLNCDLWG